MPIKNYTTKIDCYKSIGEIQGVLARHGARKIMIDYGESGHPNGIAFDERAIGKSVFLYEEQAEKALEELSK